jgi:hypothetical protein
VFGGRAVLLQQEGRVIVDHFHEDGVHALLAQLFRKSKAQIDYGKKKRKRMTKF